MQLHRVTGVMCGSLAGSSASHGAMACSSIHPSLAIYEGFLPFWTGCHCKEEMVQYVVGTAPHTWGCRLSSQGLDCFGLRHAPTQRMKTCVCHWLHPAVLGFRPECSKYSVGGKCVYSVRTCAFVLEAFLLGENLRGSGSMPSWLGSEGGATSGLLLPLELSPVFFCKRYSCTHHTRA